MKKMIKSIVLLSLVTFTNVYHAQQDPHFTQYFENTLMVNPAYAGSKGVMNVMGLHRDQWLGFEGRPTTSNLMINTPLNYESVGLGLTIINDKAGPLKQSMIFGDFSYSLKFKKNDRKLSFGLKAGVNIINLETTTLVTTDPNDPKLAQNTVNQINPNLGAGIYYHTPKFFIGASVPKILEKPYSPLSVTSIEKRHYYGIIGGVFDLNSQWKLRPTSQVKFTMGAPLSLDASLTGIYRDKLWIGSMFRVNSAIGVFAQIKLNSQLKIGFASDFGTQEIRNYNYGTFEVLFSYDFMFNKQAVRSPRYF